MYIGIQVDHEFPSVPDSTERADQAESGVEQVPVSGRQPLHFHAAPQRPRPQRLRNSQHQHLCIPGYYFIIYQYNIKIVNNK